MCEPNARRALEGSASVFLCSWQTSGQVKGSDPAQAGGSLPSETRLSGRSHQYFGTCGGCGHTYGGIAAQMMQSLRSHRPMQFP